VTLRCSRSHTTRPAGKVKLELEQRLSAKQVCRYTESTGMGPGDSLNVIAGELEVIYRLGRGGDTAGQQLSDCHTNGAIAAEPAQQTLEIQLIKTPAPGWFVLMLSVRCCVGGGRSVSFWDDAKPGVTQ
jgi:hypothetical protein